MLTKFKWLRASPERRKVIIEEISFGSDPRPSFYLLLIASALIASFGLVANSTAVIIGAMVVSPLMTPILGISLALVRSDSKLLGRALSAEMFGITLAIIVSALFGLIPLAIEPTTEMLLRTQPNLLDLLVAVFAGLAGSYAMVDERISPALPGVAIATAIVPPLSNTGLCIALGAYNGAFGSFLLFIANFFSILVVASIVFVAAGLEKHAQDMSKISYVKRFGVAVIGFLAVAVFLTHSLGAIIETRDTKLALNNALKGEFGKLFNVSLKEEIHHKKGGILYVLATIQTPRVVSPSQVKEIQDSMTKQMGMPVELVVRNVLAKDITAMGTTSAVVDRDLDGKFLATDKEDRNLKIETAEQVLWSELSARPDLHIANVDYGILPSGPAVMASVYGVGRLYKDDVEHIEKEVRKQLDDPRVKLLISHIEPSLVSKDGAVLYGWSYEGDLDEKSRTQVQRIDDALRQKFVNMPDVFPMAIYHAIYKDKWEFLVQVVGPKVLTPTTVKEIEAKVAPLAPVHLDLFVWSRADAVVSDTGYDALDDLTQVRAKNLKDVYFKHWSLKPAQPAK